MIFSIQKKYFEEDYRGTLVRVLPIVINQVGVSCRHYRIGAYIPDPTIKLPSTWRALPSELQKKRDILEQMALFILSSSRPEEFLLFLDPEPISHFFPQTRPYKFDHHDDIDSWVLNLSESEYRELQKTLTEHELPEDLFIRV